LIPIFILFGSPFYIAAGIFGPAATESWKLLIGLFAGQLGFLLPALAWARASGLRVLPLLRLTRPSVAALLLATGTALAALLTGYGLTSLLFLQGVMTRPPGTLYDQLAHFPAPWLSVALFAFLPGLCEELFFRGALQTGLLRRLSPASAIAMTAVLFVAFHGQFGLGPGRLVGGLALGWLAWRTGSLWPGVLAHALNNALVYFAWTISEPASGPASHDEVMTTGIIALAVGLLAFALLALAARRWLPPAPAAASFLLPRAQTPV
jgi:membrane protease YdiL (CAAX protease family)